MKIYVVRHGQTDLNKQEVFSSRTDVPLNERGIQQAKGTASKLPDDIDKIYYSPLIRTKQTAEIINQRFHVPLVMREELIEKNAGSLAGQHHKDNEQLRKYNSDLRPYGGESYDDVKNRVESLFRDLKVKESNNTLLLVTSRGIMKVIYFLLKHQENVDLDNASIHEFDI